MTLNFNKFEIFLPKSALGQDMSSDEGEKLNYEKFKEKRQRVTRKTYLNFQLTRVSRYM